MTQNDLKTYQAKVEERLKKISLALQKAVIGDFSGSLDLSDEDDEFTEVEVAINLLLDDLRHSDEMKKKYTSKRLAEITPVLQKVSLGDFSERIPLPTEGDEFTPLLIAINLMIDDFSGMVQAIKQKNLELKKQTKELEKIKSNLEKEVQKRTAKLRKKIEEVEKINELMVGRELKMAEMKKKLARLSSKRE